LHRQQHHTEEYGCTQQADVAAQVAPLKHCILAVQRTSLGLQARMRTLLLLLLLLAAGCCCCCC
jgi:hypothetical protein